jgi:cytochrome P450
LTSIATLPYLNAVLEESLRIYPPIPAMLPRLVPEKGAMINGEYVPAEVSLPMLNYLSSASSDSEVDIGLDISLLDLPLKHELPRPGFLHS